MRFCAAPEMFALNLRFTDENGNISGLSSEYRLQLDNTVGVIDSDYYFADNQGHILIQITNDSNTEKTLEIPAGKAFAQGIFVPFGITESDAAEGERHGGFGSTDA